LKLTWAYEGHHDEKQREHVNERIDLRHLSAVISRLLKGQQTTDEDATDLMACVYFWNAVHGGVEVGYPR